jgi:predicted alpha/beta superfamily hydrolase
MGAALLLLAALTMTVRVGRGQPPTDSLPKYETFTIDSRAVAERRTINVYTPPGYEASKGNAFPVLYMPDGGLAEDFPHIVTTIDSLVALKVIEPIIVVGIENTERRRDLTGPTTVAADSAIAPRVGGSAAFRSFIRDELVPEVRARYRCSDETAIVGESLAGLFVVETFLLEPTLFHRYFALSPSLWWNGGELVRTAERRLDAVAGLERTLYLTAANEAEIAAGTATLAATLKAHAPRGLTWYYEPRPDLEHGTIFRAAAPGAFAKVLK